MTINKKKSIESDNESVHTIKLNEDDEYINHNLEIRNKCNYLTKTITSGQIREIEIYPIYKKGEIPDGWKPPKSKEHQRNLNDKNARKNLIRLINTNFNTGDYLITFGYSEVNLPKDHEEAKKNMQNFIRRLNYQLKKRNLEKAKYIYITEHSVSDKIRCHHHLIISTELTIDKVEDLWKLGRRNNMKKLSADEMGLTGIATYLTKDPKGKKRWCSSNNLKKPKVTKSISKFSKKRIHTMTRFQHIIKQDMEKANQGYIYVDHKIYINKFNGRPYIYAIMRKFE